MITESLGIVIASAVTALILAMIAAGTYAFSAAPNAQPTGPDTKPSATSTMHKNQAWPDIVKPTDKPTAQRCRNPICQNI